MPRPKRNPSAFKKYIYDRSEPVTESGCWIWMMAVDKDGYGRAWLNDRKWPAHRLSYISFVGDIPCGMLVLHKCDTPACVNPDHLFLGTNLDNMRDKIVKGRHRGAPSGEKNKLAKLSDQAVLEIRKIHSEQKISIRAIGRLYSVRHETIRKVINNLSWKHV